MLEILQVMKESANKALETPLFSLSGMSGGFSTKVWNHRKENSFLGEFVLGSVAKALSVSEVNASMGKIVAAPTAGAAGILPAALLAAQDKWELEAQELLPGLYTAGAIGKIIAQEATISGADGGCQAECGTAAAIWRAGLTEISRDAGRVFPCSRFCLIHVMGWCDPIAGFVEFPCSLRNALRIVNAFISADMAKAGSGITCPLR